MADIIEVKIMKRAHRKAHAVIWLVLPLTFAAIIWVATNIYGSFS